MVAGVIEAEAAGVGVVGIVVGIVALAKTPKSPKSPHLRMRHQSPHSHCTRLSAQFCSLGSGWGICGMEVMVTVVVVGITVLSLVGVVGPDDACNL